MIDKKLNLLQRFLRTCRSQRRKLKIADSTGMKLTGEELLARTLVLRCLLRREVLHGQERHVGLLLPPSAAAVVANAALTLDRRVAVNLNYTLSADVLNECIVRCGIRHVLTSRRMIEKCNIRLDAEAVFLEDLRSKVRRRDKLAALAAWLAPLSLLERLFRVKDIKPDDLLTIIFTSGSTGRPKGVMLSFGNVGSNITAFDRVVHLAEKDVLLGILPIFHSFGYTVTLWTVLTLPPAGVYHFNPLEAQEVGKLCRQYGATIMVATPTFLRSYVRRCEPEDFAHLEVVITGAEKLPRDLADAFEKRFGVRPVEGYGLTETSPVVSANIPPQRAAGEEPWGCKEGTVGRPLPGVSVKVVDLDTGAELASGQSGMLLVKGPNVMLGYFGQPELTTDVIRDGWYTTGDVAMIDEEGFITITGRLSRFSKIGGEMVPHIRVEEAITEVLGLDVDEPKLAVLGLPDPKKGERLVVLYTELPRSPREICRLLAGKGLPPLWIPDAANFYRVESLPLLGTGKLDLKRVKELAHSLPAAK